MRRKFWREPVHGVWFVAALLSGVLAGLWLGQWARGSYWFLAVSVGLSAVMVRRRQRWKLTLFLMVGLVAGVIWAGGVRQDINRYQQFYGREVKVQGVINDDPTYGERGEQRFTLTRVVIYGENYPGIISASTYSFHDISRGDSVELQGKMRAGFGSKQAAVSFANLTQWRENHGMIDSLRTWFAAQVRSSIAEPMASLGLGFIIGQRSALPEQLDATLKAVGLTHIVVASGYNLTILVRLARRVFEKVSAYLSLVTAGGLIVGFIVLSGASPSLVRAGVVSGLGLAAWWYGRYFHPVVLIVLAMAITAIWWPPYLWSDLGWWLSFLAFYGVLVIASILKKLLHITGVMMSIVIETISATIMTLPLIIVVFNTVAPLTILANILIVPLVPLAMLLATFAGIMAALMPSAAGFFGGPAQLLLEMMVREAEWVASLHAPVTVTMPVEMMIGLYCVVIVGSLYLYHRLDIQKDSVV